MGLNQDNYQKKTYANIFSGKISVQAKEGEEGAVSRTNKNNKTVWEKHYPSITGILESIEVRKNEYLKAYEYVVHLSDVGEHYYLSIPVDSKYGDTFAKKVPNLKFGIEVTVKPYDFTDKENKKRAGINLLQSGWPEDKVPYFFTKENPAGMPWLDEQVDEEEYKIFKLQLGKFLREAVAKHAEAAGKSVKTPETSIKEQVIAKNEVKFDDNTSQDLPF